MPRPRLTMSIRVDADLARRVKEFVRHEAGHPLFLSLATFAEGAFAAHLSDLEARRRDFGQGTSMGGGRRIASVDNHVTRRRS